jgi:cytochrome c556
MIRPAHLLGVLILLGAGDAALAAVAPNTPTPMPKVKAQMKDVVDKASTHLYNIAGGADPANGPDQTLPDAAGWAKVKDDADQLKRAADWLQQPANGNATEAKWTSSAKAMSALAAKASAAAAAHNAKDLAKAANDLADTCTACHSVYKKQG